MEETSAITKTPGIAYDIHNAVHKFYFGHYLNNARHNLFKIFNHLLHDYGQPLAEEKNLADCILLRPKEFRSFINPAALYERMKQYMPVMEYLKENNNEEKVFGTLKMLLQDMNSFRNYFSHHFYTGKLVFNNFRESSKFKKSMPYLFGSAVAVARKKTKLPHEAFEEIFKWRVGKEDEFILEPSWQQEMMKQNSTEPTIFGLVFFTCLFLEAKEAALFISRIKGLKNATEDKFKANREAFVAFTITLPKPPKLESSDIKLDMVNELFRVPRNVFKKWTAEQQQDFTITNAETHQQSAMKRFKNRFDYFALRYFEDNAALCNIFFHIKIGEAYLAEYEKQEPGGDMKTRRQITKQLNAFGPLQFFHNHKNLTELGYDTSDLAEGQMIKISDMPVRYMPQYQIVDNKIGLKLVEESSPLIPEVSKRDRKLTNHDIHPYSFTNISPDIILSTYELPNLYLYNYLHRQGLIKISPHDFLETFLSQQDTLFAALKNKDGSALENGKYKRNKLPLKIQKHIAGSASVATSVNKKLKALLNNTNETLDELQEQGKLEKGKGKTGFTAGSVATWIATDIQFFSRPDDRQQKLSDFEYNTLQGYIAFFGSNRNKIDLLLKNFQITGTNNNRHPFLKPVQTMLNEFDARVKERQRNGRGPKRPFGIAIYSLSRFFKDYLFERRRYLESLLKNINDNVIDSISYFTKIKRNEQSLLDYHEPVLLPRNIFNQPIVQGLKELMQKKNLPFVTGDAKKCSPSFFLKQLMPELQDFYRQPRTYKKYNEVDGDYEFAEDIVLDKDNDLKKCQLKLKADGEACKELLNRLDNNEQDIRLEQYRDKVLFLMLQEYFNKQGIEQMDFSDKTLKDFSKDFMDNTTKTILDTEIEMSIRLNNVDIKARLPIGRYGEFRKILRDRRINELLGYFDKEVAWSVVQEELEYYNQNREKVLKACIEFEEAVYAKHETKMSELVKDNHISHYNFLQFYHKSIRKLNDEFFDEKGKIKMAELRNKFLHNQIIDKKLFVEIFPKFSFSSTLITKQIIDTVINVYSQLKSPI
jgi:hypothetical protein